MKIKKIARVSGAIALVCTLAFGGYLFKVSASPASGVTRTLIGRGTYDRFMVNTSENQTLNPTDPTVKPFQYIAMAQALGKTEPAIDVEVDTHYYNPLASTGWHKHPGPVYITVTSGQLTFYEYADPTCSPKVYSKGQGFVDFGSGHIGINHDLNNPASDVTVAITSVGGVFRTELSAPGPYCGF
jgi:quercetin dioxygenase-like cupin family protein